MRNLKDMRSLIVLIFYTLFLEGCFVVAIGISPSWDNRNEAGPTTRPQDTPKVELRIARDNIIIPTPFFLLCFDRKDYSSTLYINSKEKLYKTVDSVTYTISDLKDI